MNSFRNKKLFRKVGQDKRYFHPSISDLLQQSIDTLGMFFPDPTTWLDNLHKRCVYKKDRLVYDTNRGKLGTWDQLSVALHWTGMFHSSEIINILIK